MGNNQSPVAENQLSPTTNDSKKKNIFAGVLHEFRFFVLFD